MVCIGSIYLVVDGNPEQSIVEFNPDDTEEIVIVQEPKMEPSGSAIMLFIKKNPKYVGISDYTVGSGWDFSTALGNCADGTGNCGNFQTALASPETRDTYLRNLPLRPK